MEKIPFKTKNTRYGLPVTFYMPKDKAEGEVIVNKETERKQLPVDIRVKSYEDISPIAYLLSNGIVVVERQYSYTFYKTRKDFENALKVDELTQRALKEMRDDPYYKSPYTKFPYNADPKDRSFLLVDGTSISYLEYSYKSYLALLEDFQEVSRENVKWGALISDQEDRCILFNEIQGTNSSGKEKFQRCLLFGKKDDYLQFVARWDRLNSQLWQGRNLYKLDFLTHKEVLLNNLADVLELNQTDLGYDKTAQNTIHKALWKLIYTDEVVNTLFLPLLMYLGELQIHAYGGEWRFREIQEIDAVAPFIYFQGVEFDIARNMFHKILDPDNKSLQPLAACLWDGKNENWMYKR